jgi:hypothetical protein
MSYCFQCDSDHPENVGCSEWESPCVDCGIQVKAINAWVYHGNKPLCRECFFKREAKGMRMWER